MGMPRKSTNIALDIYLKPHYYYYRGDILKKSTISALKICYNNYRLKYMR